MALTRKFLSALGIEADKIDEIIDAHVETVNSLKTERDEYKANAERLAEVEKELKEAKATIEASGKDAFKDKYEAVKNEFDSYKAEQEGKALTAQKVTAYKDMLKKAGVSEKRLESILKVTNLDEIELVEGQLKDAENLEKSIKEEWADFITQENKEGAGTDFPPDGGNAGHMPVAIPTIF